MLSLNNGRYGARMAAGAADVRAAQALRYLAFQKDSGADAGGTRAAGATRVAGATPLDQDAFDSACQHVLVEERSTGRLVCCFRLLHLKGGQEIGQSYSAQFYELSALQDFPGPMLEMGRFCIHPDWRDPDILRVAWAAMTRYVDREGVEMLFGCSSFKGTEAALYGDAFTLLWQHHLGPKRWRPKVKAPAVFRFGRNHGRIADGRQALLAMPPLLRSYLAMGGWVSDHAVVDRQMNTLHVFTGLEIKAIPPARARLLRADAV